MSFKSAEVKITVSDYSKQRIFHHYATLQNDIHVISNGVNTDKKINTENAAAYIKQKFGVENFILYVSRIEPRKNHELLLHTFLKLKLYEQGVSLVFIGKKSTSTAQLLKLIKQLNPHKKAFFFWFEQVNEFDLENIYQACRFFVYPSKAEGFGIPPLEAASYEKPVLCSSTTAMQEFSFFEPNTFDPSNAFDFEQKLAAMVSSPPNEIILKEISKKITEEYNWLYSSAKFYQLLQQKL